ncbi:FliI/YscN family ATPase [Planktotalea arctica]|uniref:FliI/YscN family ATPase n=1 Tax=Planktotalea arctica TaxID=1481893 RepID=UPI000A17684B|nr:FliI/YscN family ATPase [Planktotalea arctica]
MTTLGLDGLLQDIRDIHAAKTFGTIIHVGAGLVHVGGIEKRAQVGDQVSLFASSGARMGGEVLSLSRNETIILPDAQLNGVSIGDEVLLDGPLRLAPCDHWIGRIIDASGRPMDGRYLPPGGGARSVQGNAPNPARRRALGTRLETSMSIFNTLLPVVRGQRLGLFSGSGVGKSSLLAHFAGHMQADVIVIALVGERGRELRNFVEKVLGPKGMARTVVIAATSDQSPLLRRRCALTAMTVAEHFRDQGKHVLLLADSITRFAEAHREIAVASGEAASLRGFPASTAHTIMSLCERAGPGLEGSGDITAIFSVLVAGSDMEEPIADMMRGVLDGHVVLDRAIAERGRYPAIDAVRSVSRSLPDAASEKENQLISTARRLLGSYDESALMIRAGLYSAGSDPVLDIAVKAYPELDRFIGAHERLDVYNSFQRLELILRKAGALEPSGPITLA